MSNTKFNTELTAHSRNSMLGSMYTISQYPILYRHQFIFPVYIDSRIQSIHFIIHIYFFKKLHVQCDKRFKLHDLA